MELNNISVGQKVKLVCPYLKTVFRDDSGVLVGKVVEVFCVEDNVYQVEIANFSQRFRWQSNKDGGFLIRA